MAWRARRAGVEELSAVSFCATLRVARSGSEPLKMYRARRLLDLLVWYQSELVELGKERSHEMLEIRFRPRLRRAPDRFSGRRVQASVGSRGREDRSAICHYYGPDLRRARDGCSRVRGHQPIRPPLTSRELRQTNEAWHTDP